MTFSSQRVCAAIVGLLFCNAALAQQPQGNEVERLNRALRVAEEQYQIGANPAMNVGERAVLDYGALASFNFLAIDDIDGRTHILRLTDGQVFGRLNIDDTHEFYGRLRFTYEDFNHGDDFDGRGDRLVTPLADRFWYRFDLAHAIGSTEGKRPDYDLNVQVGRQFVEWGSGMTFSDQLYAVLATAKFGDWELQGLAGLTPRSSVVDFDSSRPNFDRDTNRAFFGGLLEYEGIHEHRPYLFVLDQRDNNGSNFHNFDDLLGGSPLTDVPTDFQYNSTYIGVGSTGRLAPKLLYSIEGIYEFGHGKSNSKNPGTTTAVTGGQTDDPISAWAGKAQLAYIPGDANLTRFELETIIASGDKDRELSTSDTLGGNAPGSTDHAFNAFGFAKTGLSFDAPISNLIEVRAGAATYPFRNSKLFRGLQVGVDLMCFNKLQSSAPIDEPSARSSYLGFETDLYITWRIASDVTLNVRYGVFFPGSGVVADDVRNFLFTGIAYSF
jgi:hypothetical protein